MVFDKSFMINILLIKGNLCFLVINDIFLDLLIFYKKECYLLWNGSINKLINLKIWFW